MPEEDYEMSPKNQSEMLMETSIEFSRWINDPDAKRLFKIIIKDIPMANLSPQEQNFVDNCLDLSNQFRRTKLKDAMEFCNFLALAKCNTSLAKNGFGRKEINKSRLEQEITRREPKTKPYYNSNKKR